MLELAKTFQLALDSASLSSGEVDWNRREAIAKHTLLGSRDIAYSKLEDVFYGGDSLRPYLAIQLTDMIHLVSQRRLDLSRPLLLSEIDSRIFGYPERSYISNSVVHSLPRTPLLLQRLQVPSVCIVSLTNASRYRSRRFPLNIARLGQWLRFQHAGRVQLADLALTFDGDVKSLADFLIANHPDVLGISVNFGEMESLRFLMDILRASKLRPRVCLGNILAAWDSEEAKKACEGFTVSIAVSYGENHLEQACRTFNKKWQSHLPLNESPNAIVLPDEELLAKTLSCYGQASIETSFGCQYGHCTFCPRDHRSKGWRRPAQHDATAVIAHMAKTVAQASGGTSGVLSIVDEDAFGQEGRDPDVSEPSIVSLVSVAAAQGIQCEIYTRLEQIFDRGWNPQHSILRLTQLRRIQKLLARVFVGVESGSNSQLRRYGKGQTIEDITLALRAGSLLGLPLEFGFITFDPLLTQNELVENLLFLARTDILVTTNTELSANEIYDKLEDVGLCPLEMSCPIYSRVAYMATELELFANSPFLKIVKSVAPHLLGKYDSAFARFEYIFADEAIGEVASYCRIWTESTFAAIYRIRLEARSYQSRAQERKETIRRYREATFVLLCRLTAALCHDISSRVPSIAIVPTSANNSSDWTEMMNSLWLWVIHSTHSSGSIEQINFRIMERGKRRDS